MKNLLPTDPGMSGQLNEASVHTLLCDSNKCDINTEIKLFNQSIAYMASCERFNSAII